MENWQSFVGMFYRHDWTIDKEVAEYKMSRIAEDGMGGGIYTLTDNDTSEELARGDLFSVLATLLMVIGTFSSKED